MVKKKIEAKIKQDPVSVIIVILVFSVLMLCALVFMHVVQEAELKQLRHDLNQEIQLREVR
jgi:CHASE1-domain containing sensor protein